MEKPPKIKKTTLNIGAKLGTELKLLKGLWELDNIESVVQRLVDRQTVDIQTELKSIIKKIK